jgi:hypothetical protein
VTEVIIAEVGVAASVNLLVLGEVEVGRFTLLLRGERRRSASIELGVEMIVETTEEEIEDMITLDKIMREEVLGLEIEMKMI